MSELWQGVLLGALFSIPISLVINIVSPYITRRIDKHSETASARRAQEDAAFRADAVSLAKDRPALYIYLLEALIRIAYIGAIFAISSGAVAIMAQLVPYLGYLTQALYACSQALALIGTLVVLNIARPAVQMIREVREVSK